MAYLPVLLVLPLLAVSDSHVGSYPAAAGMRSDDLPRWGYTPEDYVAALAKLDFEAVKTDLTAFMTQSQDFWPADYGHYGGLLIRQAWHCAGTYRSSDGRGGCDGGSQRFGPSLSWEDNANLDKSKTLLWPIKEKFGLGLSWGDLIILAGNVAIESMGGPVLGFCAGRVDAADGSQDELLGPTARQESLFPCPVNGDCKAPLGPDTVGLIYVNPQGPMANPIPRLSAGQIRDTFGRMGMNDSETVALIGGGHAFGKTHGACPEGPGPSPQEDPTRPWPGKCGSGKGKDAYTSGLEGPWTTNPTQWDNSYFKHLQSLTWELYKGPGNKWQWRVQNATGALSGIMMLTTDIALLEDPEGSYQKLVREFAEDAAKLDHAFAHAWYKLATRDMGPVTRCLGKDVPPAQPWQYPLPAPSQPQAKLSKVRAEVVKMLNRSKTESAEGFFSAVPFARLAWRCASTFRATDYRGGCNGARIRFSPEKDWPVNKGLDQVLESLQLIQDRFAGRGLPWADLIVLAGNTAVEELGGKKMQFCSGRSDAADGQGSHDLDLDLQPKSWATVRESFERMGLSAREMVVLSGGARALGFAGAQLSNSYLTRLLGIGHAASETDLMFKFDPVLAAITQEYASDNGLFLEDFAQAWTKVMDADRFKGPRGNVCARLSEPLSDRESHLRR
ncbi:unnamed protein product [Polarella glacialis]|uniref:Plant heme peroxidase family profile domain-containing protein n=1 Tax=Polarella glacialis TaxID=89957 RepID=A0A813EA57_POLGL|nr:unnamed protein product [Polarella glacialis]CAE8676497.1 unnamed protein product [Polarella glacialis]